MFVYSPGGESSRKAVSRGVGGFTLIELIVVCAIIGALLTLAVPSLRNTLISNPLKASTRQIIGFVSGLREKAERHGTPFLLHIDTLENKLWYQEDSGEEEKEALKEKDQTPGVSVILPETVQIGEVWTGGEAPVSEAEVVIWISPKGLMNPTMIQLQDDNGDELTVRFFPFLETPAISDTFTIPERQ